MHPSITLHNTRDNFSFLYSIVVRNFLPFKCPSLQIKRVQTIACLLRITWGWYLGSQATIEKQYIGFEGFLTFSTSRLMYNLSISHIRFTKSLFRMLLKDSILMSLINFNCTRCHQWHYSSPLHSSNSLERIKLSSSKKQGCGSDPLIPLINNHHF